MCSTSNRMFFFLNACFPIFFFNYLPSSKARKPLKHKGLLNKKDYEKKKNGKNIKKKQTEMNKTDDND